MGNSFTSSQTNTNIEESSEDEDFLPAVPGMDFAMDAVGGCPCTFQNSITTRKLTLDNIHTIEKELDFGEKVSLVYLLYDDAEVALQYLIQTQNGANICLIHEWATLNQNSWSTKLLEALAIIQNYKILHEFGYHITEINERFLPLNETTSLEVDMTKKRLYRFCENLTFQQSLKFLDHLKNDFKKQRIDFKSFNGLYLEMYLLYCTTKKYITSTNYTNLANILKLIDMLELSDYLKSIAKFENNTNNQTRLKQIDATYLDDIHQAALLRSSTSSNTLDRVRSNADSSYKIDNDKPGVCLIINQARFYTEPDPSLQHRLPNSDRQLETRVGTELDCIRIKNIMDRFGFRTIVEENLDHKSIISTVKSVIRTVSEDESSLFIYILSHGIEGQIYGNNSIPVEVSELQKIICHTNLSGKPKILIIQACQGTECQEIPTENDIEMDGPAVSFRLTPKTADMLVFWATVPGFGAIRDKKNGTWFIQSLCDKLQQHYEQSHFEDICTKVIQDVIIKKWGLKVMVPIKESTLSAFLYLPPMKK